MQLTTTAVQQEAVYPPNIADLAYNPDFWGVVLHVLRTTSQASAAAAFTGDTSLYCAIPQGLSEIIQMPDNSLFVNWQNKLPHQQQVAALARAMLELPTVQKTPNRFRFVNWMSLKPMSPAQQVSFASALAVNDAEFIASLTQATED